MDGQSGRKKNFTKSIFESKVIAFGLYDFIWFFMVLYGFFMILYGLYMILYGFDLILYGFCMILYDSYMIFGGVWPKFSNYHLEFGALDAQCRPAFDHFVTI